MLRRKLKRGIETCVLMQNDCKKIKIARARLYEGDRVVGRDFGYAFSWSVVSTPLKNMKVSSDDSSQYMEK